ncbi:N-acetyl-D-glucosamine kinase [Anthonomus grandis grandis]|uniref:N-acetyl-D-glucosamine kinase n=1 Tax=Anthonomus grandis grandis TaxID=2921223 RepID=UPI0021651026|nr:N-acetyl-D-glucosamine kinase [Anthonomus grandis grandis]
MSGSEIIAGIEGGASNTTTVLLNRHGKIVATAKGDSTNHFLIGMDECLKRLAELINQAKTIANIPLDTPIAGAGLSLSGVEGEESRVELLKGLQEKYPNLASQYWISSDTEGSIATVSSNGGVVCIAGTGSNTVAINPDGTKVQCGGWGHLLGDEGSAWNISWTAIKYCFDSLDDFQTPPYSTDKIWQLVRRHFDIRDQFDILNYFYNDFSKSRIALMCKSLAKLAEEGDLLAKTIFSKAGGDLAKAITAVHKKVAVELKNKPGGLQVICVGSVWLSWSLLQSGFEAYLENNTDIKQLTLLRLQTEGGVGAAYMAADKLNLALDRAYEKNYKVFYVYGQGKLCNGNSCDKK